MRGGNPSRLDEFTKRLNRLDCCAVSDACLVQAANLEARIQCHLEALAGGCTLRDAKGSSYRADDATCLPMMACIRE